MLSTSDPKPATIPSSDPVGTTTVEERRASQRIRRDLSVNLRGLGDAQTLCCTLENINEGGLFVRVPRDHGIGLGQRCELRFDGAAHSQGLSSLAGLTLFATIVRTESVGSVSKPTLGIGVRFDQPLFL